MTSPTLSAKHTAPEQSSCGQTPRAAALPTRTTALRLIALGAALCLSSTALAAPTPPAGPKPKLDALGAAKAAKLLSARQRGASANSARSVESAKSVAKAKRKPKKAKRRRHHRRRAPRGARGHIPFQTGEVLTYQLTWMGIPVGKAEFTVTKDISWKGKPAWHFEMKARTNSYADAIYKVRDHMHGWADPRMRFALHHEKSQHEGSYHREVVLAFNWRKKRAVYRNQWKPFPPKPLYKNTFDPLGLLYGFRCQRFDKPGAVVMSATDGLKTIRAKVRVIGKERLTVADQPIDTWHVVPELKDVGGIFERSPGARMDVWFSADEYRIPVRMKSKVIVGSFVATLVDAKGLKG